MAGPEIAPDPTAATGTGPRGDSVIRPGIDYRQIQQAPELLQPWHIPQSGREQEFEELTRTFSDFAKQGNEWGTKLAKQAGENAGAAAGEQPGFNPKTGLAMLTPYGESFNAAAHVTYTAQSQVAAEDAVSKAELANPRNPDAYLLQATAARDAALKETPPLYQPEMLAMYNRRIEAGKVRISEQTIKGNQSDAEFAYTATLPKRLEAAVRTAAELPEAQATAAIQQFMHDDAQMRQSLVASNAWSQTRADAVAANVQEMAEKAIHANHAERVAHGFMDTIRAGDVDAADAQVSAYLKDEGNSDEDKQRVLQSFERQREEYTKFQSQLHADDIAALSQQLTQDPSRPKGQGAYGAMVESQIHGMYQRGWITDGVQKTMLDQAARNAGKGITADSWNATIEDALQNGHGLDPANKKLVEATGPYFELHMQNQGVKYGDPVYAASVASFAHATNIVPPTARAYVRVGLLSGDPQQVAYAARLSAAAHDANPQAAMFDDNETKLASFSTVVNDALNGGASPEQALAQANAQINVTPEQRKARADQYSAALSAAHQGKPENANAAALQAHIDKEFGGFFRTAPKAEGPGLTAMRAEYDAAVQRIFPEVGNIGTAQDIAFKQLLKTWGPSKVNGESQMMKWPIPDEEVPGLRATLERDAASVGYSGDPKGLTLVSTPRTDATGGRLWGVSYIDQYGVPEPLLGPDHRPALFDRNSDKPDIAAMAAKRAADAKAQFEADRARQLKIDKIMGSGNMFSGVF